MDTLIHNRDGKGNSLQISVLASVPSGDTEFPVGVLLKNVTESTLTLSVKLLGMTDYITTLIYPGWNVELVKAVQGVEQADSLQYGY